MAVGRHPQTKGRERLGLGPTTIVRVLLMYFFKLCVMCVGPHCNIKSGSNISMLYYVLRIGKYIKFYLILCIVLIYILCYSMFFVILCSLLYIYVFRVGKLYMKFFF